MASPPSPPAPAEDPTSAQMCRYIIAQVENLSLLAKRDILFFVQASLEDADVKPEGVVTDMPSGTYVDLDRVGEVNPQAIVHIHRQVRARVEALGRPATGPPEPLRR